MTVTSLNLYVLAKLARALEKGLAPAIAPTDFPHLRRCIKAGLLTVDASKREGRGFSITTAGQAALAERRHTEGR
jgi:ribosomal protein L13E